MLPYKNSTNFIPRPPDYSDNFLKKTVITLIMSTYICIKMSRIIYRDLKFCEPEINVN